MYEGTNDGIKDLAEFGSKPPRGREDTKTGGEYPFTLQGNERCRVIYPICKNAKLLEFIALHEFDILCHVSDEESEAQLLFQSRVEFGEEDKPFHEVCALLDNVSVKTNVRRSRSGYDAALRTRACFPPNFNESRR